MTIATAMTAVIILMSTMNTTITMLNKAVMPLNRNWRIFSKALWTKLLNRLLLEHPV